MGLDTGLGTITSREADKATIIGAGVPIDFVAIVTVLHLFLQMTITTMRCRAIIQTGIRLGCIAIIAGFVRLLDSVAATGLLAQARARIVFIIVAVIA